VSSISAAVVNQGGTLEDILCVRVFDPGGLAGCLYTSYCQLKKAHSCGAVGVDLLSVMPVDEEGNTCLIMIVVFYTKYVWSTPAKEYTAHTVASALFTLFCTLGMYDAL